MIRRSAFLIAVVFFALMCVPGNEGQISFAVENGWAARGPDRGESQFRFLRMRSRGAPRPGAELGFLVGNRRHFGWPCWSAYLDSGRETHSNTDIWYFKIDLFKSAANFLVAIPIGIGVACLGGIVNQRRSRRVPTKT